MAAIGPEGKKQLEITAQFAAAGLLLATSIVVGYFGGRALDHWLNTEPYCGYAGFILGVIAGFRNLFLLARRARSLSDDSDHKSEDQNPNDS